MYFSVFVVLIFVDFILDSGEVEETLYTVGKKDICTIFFYTLAWIVVHAIIQEYILDVRKISHLDVGK